MALPQAQQPERKIPSRKTLELYLSNEGMEDTVRDKIVEFNLPYAVKWIDDKWALVDTLSAGELHLAKFITEDPETLELKVKASKASKAPNEVLIIGPTGTGKEIIAKSMIADRKGMFKAINCAGIPETLIESILFGYVKGAFTGAYTDRKGFMAEAADGVMFLDEVGELPLMMQSKLLRVIQEKCVCPVGAMSEVPVNCKFVFATNKNLKQMVKDRTFREDLYARISMLEMHIKPLVSRMCDVIPICKSLPGHEDFLKEHGDSLRNGILDLSLNVRSIQNYVVRHTVWGTIR